MATLTRFDLDSSEAPAKRLATLRIDGPPGSFNVTSRAVDQDLWGLTPEQIAQVMWPDIMAYVLSTISIMASPPPPLPVPVSLEVPVVFA